ncbi:hypothetical protein NDU88_002994 [Pleurodeles waltl]|uniref:Uncharacterized protein n=1 Tax=Pleurodeles waltl TaxID=8319 RepID=A0AAV7TMC4_PLEWA|nr:hypothetical protein NDU88_002994 [Pleurodeles waltl]
MQGATTGTRIVRLHGYFNIPQPCLYVTIQTGQAAFSKQLSQTSMDGYYTDNMEDVILPAGGLVRFDSSSWRLDEMTHPSGSRVYPVPLQPLGDVGDTACSGKTEKKASAL